MGNKKHNHWKDIDAVNEQEATRLWEQSASYKSSFEPDLEAGLASFRKGIKLAESEGQVRNVRYLPRYNVLKIAAAILFVLGSVVVWQYFVAQANMLELAAAEQVEEVLLADGTFVTLNKNSTLSYPPSFDGRTRRVKLEGEAFFKVARNVEKPFIITAGRTDVQVLGTAFNVRAYEDENFVEVGVKEGRVSFGTKGNKEKLILTADERGTYFIKENKLKEERSGTNEWAWQSGELRFKNANMFEIEKILERYFGVNIILKGSFDSCPLTANFGEEDSLSVVLEAIGGNIDISIEKSESGQTYTLIGRCE